jgi:lipoprotein-anchoring transpeptidase ErfK/SrfK
MLAFRQGSVGSQALKTYPLALLSSLLIAPQAFAAAAVFNAEPFRASDEKRTKLVQLAQAYDFDVYIDQYGREIIVDPRTGQVVEIRGRSIEPMPPQPQYREYDRRGHGYDFSDPRDVERFHRDREAAITRGWQPYEPAPYEPAYGEPGYRPYDDGYREPGNRGYEELPRGAEPGYQDRSVRRAPLGTPMEDDDIAAAPQPEILPPAPGSGNQYPRQPTITVPGSRRASEDVAAYQILLDRAGASPGVIDGLTGDNVNKAIEAYYEITGQRMRTYDKEWIEAELERTGGPAFIEYTITAEDAAGPYVASVPEDYGEKAKLERLSYTRVTEMLAERFHMDEKFLVDLNPGADFNRPGTILKVANPGKPLTTPVARIIADKGRKQVRLYGENNRLVGAYPATIGSTSTPSPTGTHEVTRIALNPEYTYNPKVNFQQGNNDRVLKIPPGPNNPVGTVWIALSKPTYGIHGTPDPSKIGKTYSNGCIRLTNWDAEELAKRVKPGVTVEFVE